MSALVISRLIERLSHPDFATRKRASEQLAELGEPAVPALLETLQAPSIVARVRAVDALGQIGTPRAILPLAALLETNLEEELLVEVIGALGKIEEQHGDSPPVQEQLREAKRLYDKRLTQNLQYSQSRYQSLLSWDDLLSQYQRRQQLTARLPKPAPERSGALQRELPSDITALIARLRDPDYASGKRVMDRLVELGDDALEPLIEATLTPLAQQRAARVLGKLGNPRVVGHLIVRYRDALSEESNSTSDIDLTAALHEALVELAQNLARHPPPEHLHPLLTLTKELRTSLPQAAVIAARGLGQLAQTHPTPELRQALPALKGGFFDFVPQEFHAIRRVIEQATAQWKDLPLAASAPCDNIDLPLPASEAEDRA